jgi:hypothetical protein
MRIVENVQIGQQLQTHLLLHSYTAPHQLYFASFANGKSFALPNKVQGLNLQAPLCLLENQKYDMYGTNQGNGKS